MKNYMTSLKKRLRYFFEQNHQVYICQIDYKKEPFVHFGVCDLNAPYEEEYELRRGIFARKLANGVKTFITYKSGEYCTTAYNMFTDHEWMVIVYRPSFCSLMPRDEMLNNLFIWVSCAVEATQKITEDEYKKGKLNLEQMNANIRHTNIAQFEIDQLMNQYCNNNI
ncbi:hypothetical protein [Cellulosilyticum ruminicola]|uniref:hypothetical protein n=1 Tax=Cellulosilyticum ruminicola TaxID=425254 RepID=UPI0006D0818F|nr:hypothetical protein [Cellulosilyticum ruminicola]